MKKITLFFVFTFVSLISQAEPLIIYVSPTGSSSESVNGLSWANAVSLERGKNLSNYYFSQTVPVDNQVWVKAGTYTLTTSFNINLNMAFYGGFAGNETQLSERNWVANQTILNQTGTAMVIWTNLEKDVLLDGFILQGGRPNAANGCGQIAQGTTLRNCIIRNNKANGSTGALNFFAVSGSTKKVTLDNCLIINNESTSSPGSIAIGNTPADILNCTIANNLSTLGSTATISIGTTGTLNLYNTIVYGNYNTTNVAKALATGGTKTLTNNAWDNAATDGTRTNNIVLSNTPFISATSFTGAANGTSQLASAIENANFRLATGSTCINAGNNTNATATTDLSGVSRKIGTVDIGCYEYGVPTAPDAITATAGDNKAIVGFTAPSANGGSVITNYTVTSVPGGITASGSSSPIIVTGLTNGIQYGFTVKAANANGKGEISVQSSAVTPHTTNNIITISNNANISSSSLTAISDVKVDNGAELIVNSPTTVNSITVTPGSKLTLTSGNTLTTESLTLKSDATGIATLVDNTTSGHQTITATVEQYFGAARNWYVSPAVNGAKVPAGKTYYMYNEIGNNVGYTAPATAYWLAVTQNQDIYPTLGYIIPVSETSTISSTGTLVSGEVWLTLSRQGAVKPGFNLVANPYVSYLDWSMVDTTAAHIMTTVWYRTKTAQNAYTFDTFNGKLNVGTSNGTNLVTKLIPPKQAFWVRVKSGYTSGTLVFTNAMRKHADNSSNLLKAPTNNATQLIRLKISNGINSDEAIICFQPEANAGFDGFDSQKMSNDNAAVPEIYTKSGAEKLTINGLNEPENNFEMPLCYKTEQQGLLSIQTAEISNLKNNMRVFLRDKVENTETELTTGTSYTFSSAATIDNESRFSLFFRVSDVNTDNTHLKQKSFSTFCNENGQLVLIGEQGNLYTIFNSAGIRIYESRAQSNTTICPERFKPGMYLVSVKSGVDTFVEKVLLK